MLFRSQELSALTHSDVDRLRELGLRLIVDLRSDSERSRRPSRQLSELGVELLCAGSGAAARDKFDRSREILLEDPGVRGARRMMLEIYRVLPSRCAGMIGQLMQRLIDGSVPVLVHCTAGKDRTGFVYACVHHALGVPRDLIYADYLRSREVFRSGVISDREAMLSATARAIEDGMGIYLSRAALEVIGSVEREYLDAAFSAVERDIGSVERYLEQCGADASDIQCLRAQLLKQ
jgi:protein-tyrosine phosphatase